MVHLAVVRSEHAHARVVDVDASGALDRDGVLVEEVHYLHRPADVRPVPGAAEVVREANRRGVFTVVVTNQSGVGRGYYDWCDFAAVQERMLEDLAAAGARLDAVFACPHHREALLPYRHPDPPARKPNPGMLLAAAAALPIALEESWIVGDRHGDLEAGRRAGLAGGLLVDGVHSNVAPPPCPADQASERPFLRRRGRSITAALRLPLFGGRDQDRP